MQRSAILTLVGLALLVSCTPPAGPAPAKKREPARAAPAPATTPATTPTLASMSAPASAPVNPPDPSGDPLIRERVEVEINGVTEQWTLRWNEPPKPYCEVPELAMICPCAGFAYGEQGSLSLIRERPGMPKEKLLLDPMFAEGTETKPASTLQRYPYEEADGDFSGEQFEEEVAKRKVVSLMQLKDFNQDGLAAEFVLQINAGPCGHQQGVLLGVDARGGPIKVFGGAAEPAVPLVMEYSSWYNFLLKRSFDSLEFGCGDHGSEEEMVLHLSIKDGAFVTEKEVFDCSGKDGLRGKSLLKKSL